MNVLQVSKYFLPHQGGVERYVYNLATTIEDCHVDVLCANTTNQKQEETYDDIPVTRLPRISEIFSTPLSTGWYTYFNNDDHDIYHLHLPNPIAVFFYLLANPEGKLVITWHSDIVKQQWQLALYKPFLQAILKQADRIIATSHNYAESSPYLQNYQDKCTIIPIGIDTEKYHTNSQIKEKAEEIRQHHGDKLVVFVGRLIYYKGVEYLIRAMKDIKATLIVIGDGPLRQELEQQAGTNTHFLGYVDDLRPYYQAADVFVLPSIARSEAFGIVQLEAMAMETPVVSTALHTGVDFVNQHETTGLVVPPKDSESLAAAITKLLNNPDERERMGRNGKQRVNERFTAEQMASDIINLYNQIHTHGI